MFSHRLSLSISAASSAVLRGRYLPLATTSVARMSQLRVGEVPVRKTAALLVIGDEILKGATVDTNSNFLCRKLHSLGVAVKKISVIGDNVEDIQREVCALSAKFDYLFTTGGVGPTHDDVTYLGIARAFDEPMIMSNEILEAINKFAPHIKAPTDTVEGSNAAQLISAKQKLSTIPQSSQLLWGTHKRTGKPSAFPVVRIRNVIVFPGIPRFCHRAFEELQDQLFPPSSFRPLFTQMLYTSLDEFEFAEQLTTIARQFGDKAVEIGSYPEVKHGYYKTKLVVECEDETIGRSVGEKLKEMLSDSIVHYDDTAWKNPTEKLQQFRQRMEESDPEFVCKLDEAMEITGKILDEYPLDQVALSFNGGKDCTVLLHLLRAKVDEKYGPDTPIFGFHIMCDDQFPELTQFIIDAAKLYNITVLEFPGPLKTGLALLKEQRPSVMPVFMGSRWTDPRGKYMKSHIEYTDADWPRVLRVCPILNWSYSDVWKALRGLCIPYCSLYDQGYTSLGGRESTRRNPLLRVVTKAGAEIFLPAYKLTSDDAERHGRSKV